jgi:hypothetical protein
MIAALSIARSGLLASIARLDAAAANIAHADATGPLSATPAADALGGAPAVYQPVEVVVRSVAPAGVSAAYRPASPPRSGDTTRRRPSRTRTATSPRRTSTSPRRPSTAALASFRANLVVLRTAAAMAKTLLDLRA